MTETPTNAHNTQTVNVWDLRQGQFCWLHGEQYQCQPDRFERRPRLGEVLVRTIKSVSDPSVLKKSLGMGFDVEILP